MTDITELATVLRLAAESEIAYRAEGDTSDLWQDEASPDNVLALVEALEKAQQRIDELENDEVRQRLANAEHQLYMAELSKNNLRASRKAQFRKRRAAEKRIAELEESHAQVIQSRDHYKRMSEEGLKQLAESCAVSAESFTCPRCGRTTTHPEGWNYCHKREAE